MIYAKFVGYLKIETTYSFSRYLNQLSCKVMKNYEYETVGKKYV